MGHCRAGWKSEPSMYKLLAALAFVVAGLVAACGAVTPSPSRPLVTSTDPPPSVAIPTASAAADISPCAKDQVRLTVGQQGAAAGTNYLTVFVELAQGPACALPWGLMIEVRDAAGDEIARGTETSTTPVALTYITRYYIAWSGDCGPTPSGDLVAHIDFSPTFAVDLPIGTFRPSCIDGTGQSISMYADEPGP